MDCNTASRAIEARADREHGDTEALMQHLAGCRECRERARGMARLSDLLDAAATVEEPPAGFEGRVAAQLSAGAATVPRRHWARRWEAIATFAAGVATGLALAVTGASVRRDVADRQTAVSVPRNNIVGTLIGEGGAAQVLPPGHAAPIATDGSIRLVADSLVWVRGDGGARVVPKQGGLIQLAPGSVARLTEGGVAIYRGTAHLDVCRGDDPFVVELPAGQALLDQARLSVSVDGATEDARLQIHSGCVWVGNHLGSVDLREGQRAVAAPGAPPVCTSLVPVGLTSS
jgi:ferric-dicitrate binding protein FerR (iron transport regulator)